MTLLARVAWFVLGLGLIISAMLISVYYAHAEEDAICGGLHRPKSQCEQLAGFGHNGEHFTKDGIYVPPNASPWMIQRDKCINYGAKTGRNHGESQNDWLLFCMQQAHWQICENCRVDPNHNWGKHQTCSEIGTAALYEPECWQRDGKPEPFNVSTPFRDRVPW